MTTHILTDIDLTLLQTRRWIPQDIPLTPAALDQSGQTNSFFTPQQRSLLALLDQADQLIPVTARNSEALSRVLIPFTGYKIVSHGALILTPDGDAMPEWLQHNQLDRWCERIRKSYATISKRLSRLNQPDLRHWIVEDHKMPVYIAIKGDKATLSGLKEELTKTWCLEGALLHHNGREMALLPPFARKEVAVDFLLKRIRKRDPHALFIGLGDSDRDLPFMRFCHYMVTPTTSQIAEKLGQ